jgi:hypothetical protein
MPLEEFRSRETIQAAYFDGSLESALEVARLFPGSLQVEFTAHNGDFLLRARDLAAILTPHVWVYKNGSDRLEWRDQEELLVKWEPGPNVKAPKERKRK